MPPLPGITLPHVFAFAPWRTLRAFWQSAARRWPLAAAYSALRLLRRCDVIVVTMSLFYCIAEAALMEQQTGCFRR